MADHPLQASPRPSGPLLTIAIPTFNRSHYLAELLAALAPQLAALADHDEVELLVSDNASSDDTAAVVRRFSQTEGLHLRSQQHARNLGSDANFVSCFEQARGRYVWICGDDDIIVPRINGQPGAVERLLPHLRSNEFDLVYATSYPFRGDWQSMLQTDPFGRSFHVVSSARRFTRIVNIMFTFISGMIVNKERFLELQALDRTIRAPREFIGSNLTQLSWTLPLLRRHRQSLVLWDRPLAGRQGNAAGYALGTVFGLQLVKTLRRCLLDRAPLRRILLNTMLRRWLPSVLYDLRLAGTRGGSLLEGSSGLRRAFARNPRFWLFAWPVLRLPLPLARLWLLGGASLSKLLYLVELPGVWRKQIPSRRARSRPGPAEERAR